ncbi:hypothetical protein UNDYM_1682 [Undibacterium sp. YM2]|nr:hypothetical protein UNDYM_1682 [Undibacterium sp. YM2]
MRMVNSEIPKVRKFRVIAMDKINVVNKNVIEYNKNFKQHALKCINF